MSKFDELIASIAHEMQCTGIVDESCQKTLDDYQFLSTTVGDATGDGPKLNMIAWDRF